MTNLGAGRGGRPGARFQVDAGQQGSPGDPRLLLGGLEPGQALTVDENGQPAALVVGSGAAGVAVTQGTATPTDLPAGSVYVKTVSGVATGLYIVPGGASAASITTSTTVPTDLAANAIVIKTTNGVPTDLYIGVAA